MAIREEELLTVREVARRCGRSEETVRRWIWSGKLPARKLGNQLFVAAAELDALGGRPPARDLEKFLTPAPRLTDEQFAELRERERRLRDKLFKRHGYFDTAELVRQSREGH